MKPSCMALFGIFGTHTVDLCPLNNKTSARTMVQMADKSANATNNQSLSIGAHVYLDRRRRERSSTGEILN
jgi:hypothetical protein